VTERATSADAFEAAVAIAGHAIEIAALRGDGTGMPKLLERLDALAVGTPSAPNREPQALLEEVHGSMVQSIRSALVERSRRTVIKRLRATGVGSFEEDTWASIDPTVSSIRSAQIQRERAAAADRSVRATEHYRQSGRAQYLRDAVKILEACLAFEARVTGSRLSAANCDAEFERLGVALAGSMSAWAWAFFSHAARQQAELAVVSSGITFGKALRGRFDGLFDGAWKVAELAEPPTCRTAPFDDPVQMRFKEYLKVHRNVRAAEEAAKAERERRFERWQATRASEAGDRSSETSLAEGDGGASGDCVPATSTYRVVSDCQANDYVLVNGDDGPVYVHPEMAAAMAEERVRRARQDRWAMQQEAARLELAERIGKPYEPRYLDIRQADKSG
jgi:hypothetical protein